MLNLEWEFFGNEKNAAVKINILSQFRILKSPVMPGFLFKV